MDSTEVMQCTTTDHLSSKCSPSPLLNGCSIKSSSLNNGCISMNGDCDATMASNDHKIVNGENGNHPQNGLITNGEQLLQSTKKETEESKKCTPKDTNKLIFYELMHKLIEYQWKHFDRYEINENSQAITNNSISANNNCNQPNRVFPVLKDSQKRPYMLQPSLFPMMYPTVYFSDEDDVLSDVSTELKAFLRWKMTTITANTMRTIVLRSGYKIVPLDRNPKQKTFNNWNAIWCKHLRVNEFPLIGYHQRVNHFPGSFNFGRKDHLWTNFKIKREKFGSDVFGNFHPPTFVLPHDYTALIAYWESKDSINNLQNGIKPSEKQKSDEINEGINQKLFICKPPASARGQGIDLVSNLEELQSLMRQQNAVHAPRKPKVTMVVQEYISNPCLLHNDAKFDLRIYVLITSIQPLRLYVYDDGLVRFAANRYSKKITDIKNQFIHLTNYSVNKNCVEYVPSNSIDSQDGHKWTLKTLWKHLALSRQVDTNKIWQQLIDLIIKTVISAESNIVTLLNENLRNPRSCFELLGFDILLDENLKLWLLEVNITPSLRADSGLDFSVKNKLVHDILNTLGYQLSPRFRRCYNFGNFMSPEKNDILTKMRCFDEEKHEKYEKLFNTSGFDSCKDIIDELNDDDVIHLMESEDELSRCGQFQRVFPSSNSIDYLKYFNDCHYHNLLLVAWEEHYQNQREAGINRLCSYMVQKDSWKNLKTRLEELEKELRPQQQSNNKKNSD